MILADWNVFACKFSGNEQAAFEQFCYLLFCKKYGYEMGISRYFNNPGIETNPIAVDGEAIGWQAKYYQVALSQRRRELIDTADIIHGSVEKVGVRALAAPASDIRNQLIS